MDSTDRLRRTRSVVVLLASLALVVGACTTTVRGAATPSGTRTVVSALAVPVEFLLPEYFQQIDPAKYGAAGVPFMAAHVVPVFAPNIVVTGEPSAGASLSAIADAAVEQAKQQGADVVVQGRERTRLNAGPALIQRARTTTMATMAQPEQGQARTVSQRQVFIELEGSAFVLGVTLSALPGQLTEANENFEKLLSTIRPAEA